MEPNSETHDCETKASSDAVATNESHNPQKRRKFSTGESLEEFSFRTAISDEEIKQLPSLERVMLKAFGGFTAISTAMVFGMLVASLIITGSETEKISQKSIESVMEDHLLLTSRALSAKMELQLASLENAVVTFMANAVAQASQKNSPNILKYQQGKDFSGRIDSPNSICSHIGDGKVDRLEGTVLQGNATLDFSIYTAPETSDFLKERNDSFVMNYFFRRMWEEHNSVVSMYTVFNQSKLLRFYPGICNLGAPELQGRDWFQAALRSQDHNVVQHVGPYEDAVGNGWILTLSQGITIAQANLTQADAEFLGVSATDVVISRLKQSMEVEFFGIRTASMARLSDGRVIVDPYWNGEPGAGVVDPSSPVKSDAASPKLIDIHPGIDQSVWGKLSDTAAGAKVVRYAGSDGNQWIAGASFIPVSPDDVFSRPLPDDRPWKPRYVVFVEAREADVFASLKDLKSRINDSTQGLIIIAVVLALSVWLLVLGFIKLFSSRITGPLRRMMLAADKITDHVNAPGNAPKAENSDLDIDDIPETDDEIGQFIGEFKTMVHGFNTGGVNRITRSVGNYIDNPFYRAGSHKDTSLPWDNVLREMGIQRNSTSGSAFQQ